MSTPSNTPRTDAVMNESLSNLTCIMKLKALAEELECKLAAANEPKREAADMREALQALLDRLNTPAFLRYDTIWLRAHLETALSSTPGQDSIPRAALSDTSEQWYSQFQRMRSRRDDLQIALTALRADYDRRGAVLEKCVGAMTAIEIHGIKWTGPHGDALTAAREELKEPKPAESP